MRSRLAVIVLFGAAAGLASCDGEKAKGPETASPPAVRAEAASRSSQPTPTIPAEEAVVQRAGENAPVFAVLYPGAEQDAAGEPDLTGADAGLVFVTDATPDDVVDFYRGRAEQAGLATVMSLNQGEVRAYGAADAPGSTSLKVLAHPAEDGRTQVQLTWKGGR